MSKKWCSKKCAKKYWTLSSNKNVSMSLVQSKFMLCFNHSLPILMDTNLNDIKILASWSTIISDRT